MNKKLLDTSCVATFKNGTTQEFSSIEEASNSTGLSVAAIKLRCNHPGSGGKDKTLFSWLNVHTARHFRAKTSKNKGKGLEYEIVESLKKIGYNNVCRSAGESRSLDNSKVDIADPSGELEFAIQAKHYQNFPNFFDIRDSCPDPRDFIMIWKKSAQDGKNSRGTVAVLDVNLLYKLIECYHKNS